MPRAKKTDEEKSTPKKSQKPAENVAEARPVGQGKDPLAEGNTMSNPSNSEAETHYEVKERSQDVQEASKINGQDANERAEAHNAEALSPTATPNSDASEQDEVAEGREEQDSQE